MILKYNVNGTYKALNIRLNTTNIIYGAKDNPRLPYVDWKAVDHRGAMSPHLLEDCCQSIIAPHVMERAELHLKDSPMHRSPGRDWPGLFDPIDRAYV